MTPRLIELFKEYESGHRHSTNQLTHKIAIPLILFHIVAMLDWIRFGGFTEGISGGVVGIVVAAGWYIRHDARIAVILTAFMIACLFIGRMTPPSVVVAIAAGAWLVQFSGHYVWEKHHPSFFTNILQALVGPAYFTARLFKFYP
jgi:uncharacterized membrane protein YGL010W